MKFKSINTCATGMAIFSAALLSISHARAQTNVYDDIIAISPNHTYLTAALQQTGLDAALQSSSATYTVFAPEDDAFSDLATALNTNIAGLLALPELSDILLYHVLGTTVVSSAVTNGAVVTPLNSGNTLKMTLTGGGSVYANQAMVEVADLIADNGVVHSVNAVLLPLETVVDVALNNGFTTLATAVITAELLPALSDPFGSFTVFAPTNDAFDNLAAALNTDIQGLLALSNLADILTYHVLGTEVSAGDITNGLLANPLSSTNSLKFTKTSTGEIYANQAMVTSADLGSDNGIVHVLNAVVLPMETVVDIAIDNGFSTLATAVITAELLPALTDPFGTYTVFAPTNIAFSNLVAELGTDIPGLLALPNLADILTYHVLGSVVNSNDITNGTIVTPVSTTNTLKLSKTTQGDVYVNQANVSAANIQAGNGIVHVLDAVVLPVQTVIDIALDNDFNSLASAVVRAELLPALSDPFGQYTVFAPTNEAFSDLAAELGTDLDGILALPNLRDILLYHVISGVVMSGDLSDGNFTTLNGQEITVDLSSGVKINDALVTTADIVAENGVVHVVNSVLIPEASGVDRIASSSTLALYPNPATDVLRFNLPVQGTIQVINMFGSVVLTTDGNNEEISIGALPNGVYTVRVSGSEGMAQTIVVKN